MTLSDYRVKDIAPDMTEAKFIAVLRALGSPVSDERAAEVFRYCIARRFSPAGLLAFFRHESSAGKAGWATRTFSWGNTRPPSFGTAHMGVFNQDTGTFYAAGTPYPAGRYLSAYADWVAGGVSTVARFYDHAPYSRAFSVREIVPIWAPSSDGNSPERYIRAVLDDIEQWATPTAPHPAPRIALASGHHNASGGDTYERQQTGQICAAVARECRVLGMDVRVVQPDDGLGYIGGTLDAVGRAVVAWSVGGWVPDIFLETHTEGGGGTGCFAIFPDDPTKSATDTSRDYDPVVQHKLGPMCAAAVAHATGLGIRRSTGTGVMSERATGVGGQGDRLGIFRTTAPLLLTTRRLIIEYGAHDKQPDLSISQQPLFYEQCGKATAGAFAAFLDYAPGPTSGSIFIEAFRHKWAELESIAGGA